MDKPSQGAVSTVTAFAASHAAAEEFARSSRAMNELLRIDKLEEASQNQILADIKKFQEMNEWWKE